MGGRVPCLVHTNRARQKPIRDASAYPEIGIAACWKRVFRQALWSIDQRTAGAMSGFWLTVRSALYAGLSVDVFADEVGVPVVASVFLTMCVRIQPRL